MVRHDLWVYLDNLKRGFFLKNEVKRTLLRSIKRSRSVPTSRRYHASYCLTTMPRASTPGYYSKRCTISGRVWATNKQTSYSRFVFRKMVMRSDIPGYRRLSW